MLARDRNSSILATLDAVVYGASVVAATSILETEIPRSLFRATAGLSLLPYARDPKVPLLLFLAVPVTYALDFMGREMDGYMRLFAASVAAAAALIKSLIMQRSPVGDSRHNETAVDIIIKHSLAIAFTLNVSEKTKGDFSSGLALIIFCATAIYMSYNFITKPDRYKVARLPTAPQVQPVLEPVLE